jgi:hypothetical protein
VGTVGAWIALSSSGREAPLAAVGVAATLLVAANRTSALPWGLALLGAEYAAAIEIAGGGRLDARAPVVAAALVLAAELSAWSTELRPEIPHERDVLVRRAARIGVVGAVAAAVAAAILAFAALPLDAGLAGEALGVAAAVALLALLARLARG